MEKIKRSKRQKVISNIMLIFTIVLSLASVIPRGMTFARASEGEHLPRADIERVIKPQMAIVIDDFGYDRQGIDEMLALDCTLTCAVMPNLEFSESDARMAHERGHEVILHMPMEAYGNLPTSWYGPLFIGNLDSKETAYNKVNQALNSIPYVNGMNIHMGTALSHNKTLMKEIMRCAKERDIVFLDSKTIEGSICPEVAKEVGVAFLERDIFLEVGGASYNTAISRIREAIDFCKNNGRCIVIGHVGAVGQSETARAIKDSLEQIKSAGIEIVPLSALRG